MSDSTISFTLPDDVAETTRVRLGIAKDSRGKYVPPASACRFWTAGEAIAHVLYYRAIDGRL